VYANEVSFEKKFSNKKLLAGCEIGKELVTTYGSNMRFLRNLGAVVEKHCAHLNILFARNPA
jgi:hypothetical protein